MLERNVAGGGGGRGGGRGSGQGGKGQGRKEWRIEGTIRRRRPAGAPSLPSLPVRSSPGRAQRAFPRPARARLPRPARAERAHQYGALVGDAGRRHCGQAEVGALRVLRLQRQLCRRRRRRRECVCVGGGGRDWQSKGGAVAEGNRGDVLNAWAPRRTCGRSRGGGGG